LSLETPVCDEEDTHLGDFVEDKNGILPIDAAIQSIWLCSVDLGPYLKGRTVFSDQAGDPFRFERLGIQRDTNLASVFY